MGRRVRSLAVVAVCLGALGLAPAASAGSERVEVQRPAGADCGPCPVIVFGKGSGRGRIDPVVVNGTPESDCEVAQRVMCSFLIDEFSDGAFLVPRALAGSAFQGWQNCGNVRASDGACFVRGGDSLALCAVFKATSDPNPTPASDCPPPYIQLYKKSNGEGTVTLSGVSGTETCGTTCRLHASRAFLPNETVTLSASASPGSAFVRWDNCPTVQGSGCLVQLTRVHAVCAVFTRAGAMPPESPACPYVESGSAPKPKPPRLGSRCTIPGSRFAETIRAGGTNDVVCARGGDDRAYGRGGHDLILAGGGRDRAYGGSGHDRLRGDAENDKLYAGSGQDIVESGSGNDISYTRDGARDVLRCGRGRDVAYVDRADRVARDCEVVRRTRR